jgi:adenylylsulfate kinase
MARVYEDKAAVIWLTGLSGSGKSTIADRVAAELERLGCDVEKLDGDGVREVFPTGFSREERNLHIRRMGFMAGLLNRHGVFVVASFISPYREARDYARSRAKRFVEVHVSTPLAECERRDVKGLYARARRGEIREFTGISDPYEPPLAPELTLDTTGLTVEQAADRVLDAVLGKDWRA